MANIFTDFRILCSIVLFFIPVFTTEFYCLYIIAGITDILEGN